MTTDIYAVYDGKVFKPEQPLKLKPNQRYRIRIELEKKSNKKSTGRVLQRISARAQDLGVSDLAEQHDHYLYGTEKR